MICKLAYVGQLGHSHELCYKTAELIMVPFGVETHGTKGTMN